jgi:TonB family protein
MSSRRVPFGLAAIAAAFALAVPAAQAAEIQPPRIIQTTEAKFPSTVETIDVTTGAAQLVINIDENGKLVDWLVASYTLRAFADEAVKDLRQWTFEPARIDGRPVPSCSRVTFKFRADKKVLELEASSSAGNLVDSIFGQPVTNLICEQRELDRPVRIVKAVPPVNPGASAGPGKAIVEFYVDSNGRARMPVIISASQVPYAQAAVSALNQWVFEPPTSGGRPVAVKVEQEFDFGSPS